MMNMPNDPGSTFLVRRQLRPAIGPDAVRRCLRSGWWGWAGWTCPSAQTWPDRFRSARWRDGGVLAEEAHELGAGVRAGGVGVGAVRGTTGPGMPAVVDGPALGQGRACGVLVAGAGVGMPAGHLPGDYRG